MIYPAGAEGTGKRHGGQYKVVHALDCWRYQDESLDYRSRSVDEILERFALFFTEELKLAVEDHSAATAAAAAFDSANPFDVNDYNPPFDNVHYLITDWTDWNLNSFPKVLSMSFTIETGTLFTV